MLRLLPEKHLAIKKSIKNKNSTATDYHTVVMLY